MVTLYSFFIPFFIIIRLREGAYIQIFFVRNMVCMYQSVLFSVIIIDSNALFSNVQSYGPWHLEFLHILAFLLNSSYIIAWIEWHLAGMLYHKSRSSCGEIIHVWQILAELWPLTLRMFTQFSLSSQLLLHPCMDLKDTWQGCCNTNLEVHVGR